MGVDRGEEDVGTIVEDRLGAVAVVVVDIEDGDAPGAAVDEGLRCDGGVVEEAVAAVEVGGGVVAGRAAEREGGALALAEEVGACQRRSEEHTSELQSLLRISYAVFCLKQKKPCKP